MAGLNAQLAARNIGTSLSQSDYDQLLEAYGYVHNSVGNGLGASAPDIFDFLSTHLHVQDIKNLATKGIDPLSFKTTLEELLIEGAENRHLIHALRELPDARSLEEFSEKLTSLGPDSRRLFYTDLGTPSFAEAIRGDVGLVDAWRALDNIGVDDAIRKNTDYLKNVDDYAKRSGKTPDEVADLVKNNENGIEQFLDELEDTPASGHWDKNPFQRGRDIEDDLGQNLPETFKTIDKYDDVTGEITSIKSLDLDAKTYQTPSKLKSRLNKYVKELEDFEGYELQGVQIGDIENPINSKSLELAIPRAATGEQLTAINEVIADAASKGIDFKVIVFP